PGGGIAAEPQHIDAPLSAAAAFLVLVVKDGEEAAATARSVVASTDPEDRGAKHTAVAPPPGDLLYHLRAASPT
ncbi:hypothetical protein ACWIGN_30435, partial [Streptomyces albidoflavus]